MTSPMPANDADSLAEGLMPAVLAAARVELAHFANGVDVQAKADSSPVTIADQEAEAILLAALHRLAPDTPVIAEELAAAGALPPAQSRFFLVDALDGTRYFVAGKPEFSINVALVEAGRPVFGLIYMPSSARLYVTRSDGAAYGGTMACSQSSSDTRLAGAGLTKLRVRLPDRSALLALTSRNSSGASADFLRGLGVQRAVPLGSSEKFCLIAKGEADIYARFGPTYEWDTAAGQAILEAAGGKVLRLDGRPLDYGKSAAAYLNPGFVAWGGQLLGMP